jgi:predicted SAM-dependent methyltransferase
VRLNLGAGGQSAPGWTTLDRAGNVDVIHNLTVTPLPFADDSCEGAVAHHVLDLLGPHALHNLLRDLRRVLQPDAVLRVSLADLEFGIGAAFEHDLGWFPEPRETLDETLAWFLRQGGARRLLLTPERLKVLCYVAGFNEFAVFDDPAGKTFGPSWLTVFDARFHESFFAEAW